jgi:acetyl-CoA acetyltransferase family protein
MADNGNGKFGGREVVIVEAVRTPIGRGHEEKGIYKDVHPSNLLAKVYGELFERTGVDPAETGDVIAGCAQQFGEQGVNIGRNAWLEAGLPIETPATTIDRQCGSAQQAVNFAATLIASGVHDVAIGGGVEHMGHISFADGYSVMKEHGAPFSPELLERYDLIPQGLSAEMIADQWEIPRSELDELGVRSQQLAAKATEEGRFEREIVPFSVNGDTYSTDQGIRPETSIEVLSQLKPAFKEDGKITAGNSSQISDGAAALLLASAAVSACPHLRGGPHWHRSRPGGGNSRQPQSRWSIRHRYRRRYTRSSSQEDPPWVESIGGPGR